ncbi:hypothetical protein Tco_1066525 [Tanacetum coccineum]|uniref:Uncharacterized protein n=1 Tax=Tanacetum coccineum TaxID=301880 RepID=A0ABQ5HAR0_9ASTR
MASMPSANPMLVDLNEMENIFQTLFKLIQKSCKRDEKEMNPILLKDRLVDSILSEDTRILFITLVWKNKDKDLHDEIERISKESKDVSNESKTADTVCNDAFEVTQGLSKRIVELEKDLSKFKAKSIAFEIALQHKSREKIIL